eukprot:364966-Chlamydomonas_euryale.AAC.4
MHAGIRTRTRTCATPPCGLQLDALPHPHTCHTACSLTSFRTPHTHHAACSLTPFHAPSGMRTATDWNADALRPTSACQRSRPSPPPPPSSAVGLHWKDVAAARLAALAAAASALSAAPALAGRAPAAPDASVCSPPAGGAGGSAPSPPATPRPGRAAAPGAACMLVVTTAAGAATDGAVAACELTVRMVVMTSDASLTSGALWMGSPAASTSHRWTAAAIARSAATTAASVLAASAAADAAADAASAAPRVCSSRTSAPIVRPSMSPMPPAPAWQRQRNDGRPHART